MTKIRASRVIHLLFGVMATFAFVDGLPVSAQKNQKLSYINDYNAREREWRKGGDCDYLDMTRTYAQLISSTGDNSYAARFNEINRGSGRRCGLPSLLYEGASVAEKNGTPMPSTDCISHADVLEFARTRVLHRICK